MRGSRLVPCRSKPPHSSRPLSPRAYTCTSGMRRHGRSASQPAGSVTKYVWRTGTSGSSRPARAHDGAPTTGLPRRRRSRCARRRRRYAARAPRRRGRRRRSPRSASSPSRRGRAPRGRTRRPGCSAAGSRTSATTARPAPPRRPSSTGHSSRSRRWSTNSTGRPTRPAVAAICVQLVVGPLREREPDRAGLAVVGAVPGAGREGAVQLGRRHRQPGAVGRRPGLADHAGRLAAGGGAQVAALDQLDVGPALAGQQVGDRRARRRRRRPR